VVNEEAKVRNYFLMPKKLNSARGGNLLEFSEDIERY